MILFLESNERSDEENMRQKNLGVNAVLNMIRQGLSVLFPLITYPYALRILGPVGIGKVNYSSSIVRYFSLLAMLGVTNYAIREGAKRRDDKQKLNCFINEVFSINIITTVFSYLILLLTILFIPRFRDYRMLMLLQSISMILTTLGIDYINAIYEDFFLITIRSIVTHIVSMGLLFLFVKTPDDYYMYALLSVVTNGIICISNLFYCRRYVKLSFSLKNNWKTHLKPMLILFANTLAIYIYVSVDTTMLGWIKGDETVGLYTASVNVYSILKNILAAIYIVAVPRLANFIGKNDKQGYKSLSTEVLCYLIILLIPVGVGVICIAPEIMAFMGGEEYSASILSLRILGIALVFSIFGGFMTACINITLGREKETLTATIISAIINFSLNLVVIPRFSLYGAAATTLFSEAFVFFFCFFRIPKKETIFDTKKIIRCIIDALIGVLSIVFISIVLNRFIESFIPRMILIMCLSVLSYFTLLYLLKNPYIDGVFNMLKKRIFKRNVDL